VAASISLWLEKFVTFRVFANITSFAVLIDYMHFDKYSDVSLMLHQTDINQTLQHFRLNVIFENTRKNFLDFSPQNVGLKTMLISGYLRGHVYTSEYFRNETSSSQTEV